jgi:hypothetical protein
MHDAPTALKEFLLGLVSWILFVMLSILTYVNDVPVLYNSYRYLLVWLWSTTFLRGPKVDQEASFDESPFMGRIDLFPGELSLG